MEKDEIKSIIEEYFNGQYEVEKFIGEGSFSDVFLVKHRFLDDLRAMKVIKEPLKSTTNIKNIFQEVKLATQLRNEHIISIYDAGIISDHEDFAFFVMEYVPGGDLEEYLNSYTDSKRFMPVNRTLDLIKQILTGLRILHSSKPPIVHRDLKLNNILLNYDASGDISIKISDFGFAKEMTTGLSDIDIVGTRPYMAPECFSKNISTATDIYAAGVIFYQLLTNHYPYDIDDFELQNLLDLKPWQCELTLPSHYNEKVSPEIDVIVKKSLDSDYKKRYRDAGEFLADIELIIGDIKEDYEFIIESEYTDDYTDYIVNDSLLEAFKLAKTENRLNEAVEILEKEVLSNYDIRHQYGETLRIWKSERPDVKLISKAFTVNLKAKNYKVSIDLLKEAIAYNPSIKSKYEHYFDLWDIFVRLTKTNNLIEAVIDLDSLMQSKKDIHDIYGNIINVLKSYSVDEILAEAIRMVKLNNLTDAANLMEFVVICDNKLRQKYEYKLSLWKQNIEVYYKNSADVKHDTVDYAVDLGTVDSIISYYNRGNPVIIKNHTTGEDITPSAVMIDGDEIIVGKTAREAITERNDNAVTKFKNNMGFPIPFKSQNSTKTLLPEELSAEVLKDLRLSVFKQCGEDMNHAVICVPANSNPIKTKAIRDACELAGFRSYNLIFEPIAVAKAYGLEKTGASWLVYDLGGATFNTSLIKDTGKIIEITATKGLENIGGDLIDWKIAEEILASKIINDLHLADFNRENPKYHKIFSKLKKACENAKIELSVRGESEISLNNLFDNYDLNYTLTIDEFKDVIEPVIKITFNLCHDLIKQNPCEIEKIILVGGSSLSPIIQEMIYEEFELPLEYSINPMKVVAIGAARYAGNLKKTKTISPPDSVSLVLDSNHGRLFTLDDKSAFLGFEIEFSSTYSSVKIPVGIDGKFKMNLSDEEYDINIYYKDKPVKIDLKSPSRIKNSKIYIPYFDDYFTFKTDSYTEYDELLESVDYLREFDRFSENDLLIYTERLYEMGFSNQTNIFLNYLKSIVDGEINDLKFSRLLSNVENKLAILNEDIDLTSVIERRNYDLLNESYTFILEKYVKENKNAVIKDSFFNLKYYGIYAKNQKYSEDLIEKGLAALGNSDYEKVLAITVKLFEIDER